MQYDKNRFKIHALPHPLVLHWVLNPVIMFNELILGQRLPKVTLIDKKSDKPQLERSYIPCPHCETLNDSRLWAKGNAFNHWFGFVCPSCHEIIPGLWNIFSLAILAITFPLWYFPARFFRRRWLEKEKERLAKVLERPLIQAKSINWLLINVLSYGVSMWVMWVMWVISMVLLNVWNGREGDLSAVMFEASQVGLLGVGFMCPLFMHGLSREKEEERLASALERYLIRAKSINRYESIKWFVKGTFYFGGFVWVACEVLWVLRGGEWNWDLRRMFNMDILPLFLLIGWIWGAFMHVLMNLKGRKTRI